MRSVLLALITGFCCFCGCASHGGAIGSRPLHLDAGGDSLSFDLGTSRRRGELLAVTDTSFLLVAGGRVVEADRQEVLSVKVEGYENRDWAPNLLLFEVLPAILLGVAAASVDADPLPVVIVFSIPTLLNLMFFEGGGEAPPKWRDVWIPIQPEEIRGKMKIRVEQRGPKKAVYGGRVLRIGEGYFDILVPTSFRTRRIAHADVVKIEKIERRLENLNRYARFPKGITLAQLNRILAHYGQGEIGRLDD